jgi:hypothetical protein
MVALGPVDALVNVADVGRVHSVMAHDGPALVDVTTARHELSLPSRPSYGQLGGFTQYATRTILRETAVSADRRATSPRRSRVSPPQPGLGPSARTPTGWRAG